MRPLEDGRELQYWEFAPYKMYTSYAIPHRVFDIIDKPNPGQLLIIWSKKPPLAENTQNQRFVYVHPYSDEDYGNSTSTKWKVYKQHFYIPYNTANKYDMCFQVYGRGEKAKTNEYNKNLEITTESHQIKAEKCVVNEPRQMFVPVFS